MAAAIYGLIGVLLGSATAVVLTVYQERRVSTREREARQHQREQDREDRRNTFQRQSLVDLQDAVSDLVKAVFNEQDRMFTEMGQTGKWPARQWETPTATGWVDAELRVQVSRARVFDEGLRDIARNIRALGMQSLGVCGVPGCCRYRAPFRSLSLVAWCRRGSAGMILARVSRRGRRAVPRSAAPAGGAVFPS